MSTRFEWAIVVPVLNEIDTLPALLDHLRTWQQRGAEILLVDGDSRDGTAAAARAHGFTVLDAPPGRASQMNAGARHSQAPNLVFLHADTRLPNNADQLIQAALADSSLSWGRFDVRIEGRSRLLPVVSYLMNVRSRLSGIATGDQAMFMTRELFDHVGGFPSQPLMEDIELSKRLKQVSAPTCLRTRVTTSGRRWDHHGSWRTILLMWQLRWAYWRGTSAQKLAERYR
ncbi:TIGR04283 family arsenosugar biosynthesis glycosyltransferase [Marinobacterium maritimum]|uniref:TIGR04283 family arsenosugar biosynthesis glycosyltransferase n=1 Tax=Marinobacterium maritimum TaxID=500162 RepID=A0ABN1I1J0_9GAMM